MFDPEKTIFLIDGSSFLYRGYYSLRPLYTLEGVPVQAVYSFCRMIKKMMDTYKPHYMALVWDSKGKTVRHELYTEYKATRQEPPSDLFEQKKLIQDFADLITLKQVAKTGVEADDLLFSITKELASSGMTMVLVTSDKDMGQALNEHVVILDPFKDQIIDTHVFEKKMEFPVKKLSFYFSLVGDTSDNIPGVRGIGPKGATSLVQQFDSLEDLYAHIDQVPKERIRQLLIDHKNEAFLSYNLFELRYYALNSLVGDFTFNAAHWARALPLFEKLQFKSLIKEVEKQSPENAPLPIVKLSDAKEYRFIAITAREELQALCNELRKAEVIAIDTETDGLNPLQNKMLGFSLCIKKGTAYYIPFGHSITQKQLSIEEVIVDIKPIFADETIKKVMHHANFDLLVFAHHGIEVKGLIFDTMIAAHLVTEDWQRIGLKYLSEYYLKEPMLSYDDVVTSHGYKNFSYVPLDIATEYAAADAHQTFQLMPILRDEINKKQMTDLYSTIELPLVEILVAIEREGIHLDTVQLAKIDEHVTKALGVLKKEILGFVGVHGDINLNSPKQLETLLFEKLNLPRQKKTSGKTGYSTDQEVLEELATIHPVPGLIIKYRELFKLKSTYIDALPTYINPETHAIHTTLSQTAVATGRLASSNPNLQNIPTEAAHYSNLHIRSAFKPVQGCRFLSADYSQIELRVLAHLSGDRNLINAFLRGIDIHRETASKLFDIALDAVTYEQRQIGKRINFSILYGLTPYGLSKDLKIPFKDAKSYIEKYFEQYPGVLSWMEEVIEDTKKHGYVTTLWGRRRYIPGIYEKNRTLYDLARRIAINTRAQGTAAELMKLGMININKALKEYDLDAKMILQIHDELLLNVPIHEQEKTASLVKNTLEQVVQWTVPLIVTIRFGDNWQEVTK